MEDKKISKNAKLLISSDLIYTLISLFVQTFLVAYFLKVTNESIIKIAIYYIITYGVLSIGNVIIGRFVKLRSNNRIKILSTGIILKALFILFIVLLREKIAMYFPMVAVLYGISEMFYWVSHESIYIEVTNNNNRKDYMAIKYILSKIVRIIAPIILGSSIELYSFTKVAVYIFILSLIQIVISLNIKIQNNDSNIESKYSLKEFIKKYKDNEKIRKYTKSAIAYGVIESSIQTLVVIITIMTFKTSFNLGILTSIFSVCSMIALYFYKKTYRKDTSKKILYICSTLIVVGVIGLIFDINKVTLVIYNLFYTISKGVLETIYNTKKGDLVKECNVEEYKVEYIIYVGFFIAIGRIFGYILMIIAGLFNNIAIFKILLLIVSLFAPIYSNLMCKVENEK